ncbi:MAG: hypothetical protein IPI10_14045 [Bacteroidetes bacterium]|nr:hypothetical protein [Bacteroidota bacterium]
MPEDINPDELLGIPVERRKIPVFNLEYPCLGLNDLLSKHVIQLSDYNINKDKFLTFGNRECLNILPPIKQSFFDYFTLDDLKRYLIIERLPSKAIRVVLRIPVKGDNGSGVIEYERMYTHVKPENVDQDSKGAIVELRLGLGIYPFYRVADNRFNDFYKISQYYDESIGSFNASFYRQDLNNSKSIKIARNFEFERTRKDEKLIYVSKYTELATYSKDTSITKNAGTTDDIRFDFISLDVVANGASVNGLIIPDWGQPIQLSNAGSIAFDIGTSNTYVAYSVGASAPSSIKYN